MGGSLGAQESQGLTQEGKSEGSEDGGWNREGKGQNGLRWGRSPSEAGQGWIEAGKGAILVAAVATGNPTSRPQIAFLTPHRLASAK